jgi:hypothetical protein
MPLVFNGTTIPTNVANALMYNGTSVTQVIFNGTTVWQQSLFSAIWSGSSVTGRESLDTSGSSWRFNGNNWSSSAGSWQTVNMSGVFSGSSWGATSGGSANNVKHGITVSGSQWTLSHANWTGLQYVTIYGSWLTFSTTSKWTGGSTGDVKYQYTDPSYDPNWMNRWRGMRQETSGGLIRQMATSYQFDGGNPWISSGAWITIN